MKSVMKSVVERRSIRSYLSKPVEKEKIEALLTAAQYAPSAGNFQPWRFVVLQENRELREKLSALTKYESWVKEAPCLIAIYLDRRFLSEKYFRCEMKSYQSIGSAIQNLMLAADELGLGSCWIGEILEKEAEVAQLLGTEKELELMVVMTIGYSDAAPREGKRMPLSDLILRWE